jgi:hypothetical protein
VCSVTSPSDVMGYHDAREIPNYWRYAEHSVLDDHMFASNASWSLPAHLFEVSEWSARCTRQGDPMSCVNDDELGGFATGQIAGGSANGNRFTLRLRRLQRQSRAQAFRWVIAHLFAVSSACVFSPGALQFRRATRHCLARVRARVMHKIARVMHLSARSYNYASTDLAYLMHKHGVSWGYFISPGGEPDCKGGNANCATAHLSVGAPDICNRSRPSLMSVRMDNWARSKLPRASGPTHARAHFLPSRGSPRTNSTLSIRRRASRPDRPTSPPDQHDHAGAGLEVDGHLLDLG